LFHFCARTGKLIQRSKPGIVEKEIIPVTNPDLQSLSYKPMIETFLKDPYAFINTNPIPSAAPTLKVPRPTYPLPSVHDLDKLLSIPALHKPFTSSSAYSSQGSRPCAPTTTNITSSPESNSFLVLPDTKPCDQVETITASLPTLNLFTSPTEDGSSSFPATTVPLNNTHSDSDTESASSELDHPPQYANYYNDRPYNYKGPIPSGFIKRTPLDGCLICCLWIPAY